MGATEDTPHAAAGATGNTPEQWARRIGRGDAEAVHHVRHRVRKILSYRGLGVSPQEREDLEQEVMTAIWQAVTRPGFDFAAGFWGFVEVVTSRRCIDWLRARRAPDSLDETLRDRRGDALQGLLAQERGRLASEALATVGPECRELIELRLREGISYREMASRFGRSEGALRVQMYRCIEQIRKALGTRLDDPRRAAWRPEDDLR